MADAGFRCFAPDWLGFGFSEKPLPKYDFDYTGADMAGITAARALHDASFQVVLSESREKIGGRVCTDYSFEFPVDIGASCYALFDMDKNKVPQDLVTKMMFYEFIPNGDDWASKARAKTNATSRKAYGTPITGRSSF
ncbi:hypothetical protein AgCh_018223 [Apium graveolens]